MDRLSNMRQLWAGLSTREQWMLGVMFALIGAVLLWFALLQPLSRAKATAQGRLDLATRNAGDVASAVLALSAAKGNTSRTAPERLATLASTSAVSAGFTPSTIEPQGDGTVRIVIPAAKSTTLFGWIKSLGQSGVLVERLMVQHLAGSSVSVEANLRAPQ
jgi:general secretion pathway protein M